MKNRPMQIFLVFSTFIIMAFPAHTQELGENLRILAPLIGSWEGHFDKAAREGLVISMSCEVILKGNALRLESHAGDLSREHYYYWDPEKKQIKYLVLTNNAHVGRGIVSSEDSLLVETGTHTTPDGTNLDAKASWEVSDEGRIIARGYTWKGGEWQSGHVIVFEAQSTDK